jgi:predicted RNA-binding protein YlqC (UPF0109 family)
MIHIRWCCIDRLRPPDFTGTNVSQFMRQLESGVTDEGLEEPVVRLIEAIARTLVDKPEEVSVRATSGEMGTLLRLRVDPTDVAKVIGEQGRTARSLRTILRAVSVKLGHRFSLEIDGGIEANPHLVALD